MLSLIADLLIVPSRRPNRDPSVNDSIGCSKTSIPSLDRSLSDRVPRFGLFEEFAFDARIIHSRGEYDAEQADEDSCDDVDEEPRAIEECDSVD